MASYYTTGQNVNVLANESESRLEGKPVAEVTFPSEDLDPVTVYKPYASFAEAKVAAKGIADQINAIAPRGFMRIKNAYKDSHKAERQKVETLVREWAGPEAVIEAIED